MRLRTHIAVLVQIVLLGLSLPAFAQNTAAGAPTRGMSMTQVEQHYGAPLHRHAAIGQPPIVRWDYSGYHLYFEDDHVLHAVVPGDPVPVVNKAELMGAASE